MLGFVIGAIAGGLAMYVWRDQVRTYVNDRLPDVRDRAAERLEEIGRGAEEMLDRAKSTIGSNVRAGQEKIRRIGEHRPPTAGGPPPTGTAQG